MRCWSTPSCCCCILRAVTRAIWFGVPPSKQKLSSSSTQVATHPPTHRQAGGWMGRGLCTYYACQHTFVVYKYKSWYSFNVVVEELTMRVRGSVGACAGNEGHSVKWRPSGLCVGMRVTGQCMQLGLFA